MDYLELPAPHGFLIWRGKQTAIASDKEIVDKQFLIVSNDEAFGYATLAKQPVTLAISEFDKPEYIDEHGVTPEERRLYFQDAKSLYLYRIVDWKPFKELKPFASGELVPRENSDIIEQSAKLPKTIILDKEAVTFDGENFTASHQPDYVNKILEATYNKEIKQGDTTNYVSLYQLALVRVPNPYTKKKVKQTGEMMPWEIEERNDEFCVIKIEDGEVEGCHETRDDAEDQLAALNIAEEQNAASELPQTEVKQEESISQFVDRVHQQFIAMFDPEYEYNIWVRDIYDSHIIVSAEGNLFRVNYMDTESDELVFAPNTAWREVEVSYIDKAAKLLKHFEREKNEPEKKDWKSYLKDIASSIRDFISDEPVPETKEKLLDTIDFDAPYGIAVKTVNGEPWHFTWSTNSFEDREQEIFSAKALEDFVAESNEMGYKGHFDFWHIPNTEFAIKEWKAIIGRFLVEAGPYLDNEIGKSAKQFFSAYPDNHPVIAPEGWGASPEFRFLPEDRLDGVYDWLWITKTSTLPKSAAANIWTKGSQIMNEQQEKAAVEIFGQEFVDNLKTQAVKETENLEAAGVNHKSNDEPKETDTFDMEKFSESFNKQFEKDFSPILGNLVESIEGLKSQLETVTERLDKVEGKKQVQQNNEMPRWAFQLQRASESEDTEVKESDELKERKPKEVKTSQVANSFFPS